MNISVVIIVKNGKHTIEKCLEVLNDFDDVVIFDNGSTDGSKDICRKFPNVNLIEGEFIGFGPTKKLASTYAKYDWILSIDCDEIVTEELIEFLKSEQLNENTVYSIRRINHYKEIEIKYAWSNDILPRIYNKTKTNFNKSMVHEGIITDDMNVLFTKMTLLHFGHRSMSAFILKADQYSTLFAEQNVGKKWSSPFYALFNSIITFLRKYILKLGFLDGYPGLIISYSYMITSFYKYMKLYELNKELKTKD